MRNLIFAFVTVFSVAGVTGCDDAPANMNLKIDLSMKAVNDLSKGPDGCNGLITCLRACGTGDTACENDCVGLSTDTALGLLNQAYFICPATKFCGAGTHTDAGAGGAACTTADLDPTATSVSDECNACLDEVFAQSGAQAKFQSMCKSDIDACTADKP